MTKMGDHHCHSPAPDFAAVVAEAVAKKVQHIVGQPAADLDE